MASDNIHTVIWLLGLKDFRLVPLSRCNAL